MVNIEEFSDMIYAYLAPLLGFVILSMMNNYYSALLGSEGDTKRPTLIITAGNLINVILNFFFIYFVISTNVCYFALRIPIIFIGFCLKN